MYTIYMLNGRIYYTEYRFTAYIQPGLLVKRFEKDDIDGFLDRHLVVTTSRKKVYFRDIGAKAKEGDDLATLFQEVYNRHHQDDHKVCNTLLL